MVLADMFLVSDRKREEMQKIIEFLMSGCWHVWEEYSRCQVADSNNIIIGKAVFCKCKKCGTHKRFNLY